MLIRTAQLTCVNTVGKNGRPCIISIPCNRSLIFKLARVLSRSFVHLPI